MKTLRDEIEDILRGGGSYLHKASGIRYTLNGGGSTRSLEELPSEATLAQGNEQKLKQALSYTRSQISKLKVQEEEILARIDELRSKAEPVKKAQVKEPEPVAEEVAEEEPVAEEKPAPKKAPRKRKAATKAKSE